MLAICSGPISEPRIPINKPLVFFFSLRRARRWSTTPLIQVTENSPNFEQSQKQDFFLSDPYSAACHERLEDIMPLLDGTRYW